MIYLYVRCSNMNLLIKKCPCGHLHIAGFYHQLVEKVIDTEAMKVIVSSKCAKCGTELTWTFDLEWSHSLMIGGAGI